MIICANHLDFPSVAGAAYLSSPLWVSRSGKHLGVLFRVEYRFISGSVTGLTVETMGLIEFDGMAAQTLPALFVEAGRRLVCPVAAAGQDGDRQKEETEQAVNRMYRSGSIHLFTQLSLTTPFPDPDNRR